MQAIRKNRVKVEDLGRMKYADAWAYQTVLHGELKDRKQHRPDEEIIHSLLFVEHPHVYTIGTSGSMSHLLAEEAELKKEGVDVFKINRGGDITYHGPGQIVVYPILDLDCFKKDVRWYVTELEETVIKTMAEFGVKGKRVDKYTGVWIFDPTSKTDRKICAVGVHMSRWVTLHGIAFNVNTDLSYFGKIIPCGIIDKNKTVTSLSSELEKSMDMEEVKQVFQEKFKEVFGIEYIDS